MRVVDDAADSSSSDLVETDERVLALLAERRGEYDGILDRLAAGVCRFVAQNGAIPPRDRTWSTTRMSLLKVVRHRGAASSLALGISGLAIALRPRQAATALGLSTASNRGVAETRIGLGGTFAGLAFWSLLRRRPDGYRAVGATWLGAAVTRIITLQLDEPESDWTFWAYLAGEIGLGLGGLTARRSDSERRRATVPTARSVKRRVRAESR